jgi:16S rRNA (guanine1207-N2)-methyltransferase
MKPFMEQIEYYRLCELDLEIGGQKIRYISKPGLPDWDDISPAVKLLGDHSRPTPNDLVWCINCGPGALAALIASSVIRGQCIVSADYTLALTCTELTCELNTLKNIHINSAINLPDHLTEQVDLILMSISKSRSLNRRWLLQSWHALAPGGRLLLAGANDQGIQSILKDAEQLFGNFGILGYKKGYRIAQFVKLEPSPSHPDWAADPGIAPGTWYTFHWSTPAGDFELASLPGVFSYNKLDEGTCLLSSTIDNLSGQTVLDVGCGYGVLGMVAVMRGAQSVDMVDNHLLAVAACQENIRRNNLHNCQVCASDLMSSVSGKTYSCVLSNPPFHAGKEIDYQIAHALIASAFHILEPGGQLRLVANRFIRYNHLMSELFGNVSVVAQTPAYHVLSSTKQQV